jgi:hypothetical protein
MEYKVYKTRNQRKENSIKKGEDTINLLNKSIKQDKEYIDYINILFKENGCLYPKDKVDIIKLINGSIKIPELKIPANLKPIEKIFNRKFSGLYYDEKQNLFYSTKTARKSRTFCPIKWSDILYRGSKIHFEEGKDHPTKKIYRYVTLPMTEDSFFRLSEKK